MTGRLRVVVGNDGVLGDVLDEVARRVAELGASVVRIPSGVGTLNSPMSGEAIASYFGNVDIAVVSSRTVVDARILGSAPRLRGIVFPSVGVNSCDLDAATAAGVLVANGPTEANIQSMAEGQILAILALLYRLEEKRRAFLISDALALPLLRDRSRMLAGRTLGFIGHGRITRAVVARLQAWAPGPILIHTRTEPTGWEKEVDGPRFVALDELLGRSEIVCVNATLSKSSRGLLDRCRLNSMMRGALLVVQSRGGIVDETAVAEMLLDGRLGGAAIDTFDEEPLPATHPLRASNAVLTDHNIGHTAEMFASFADTAVAAVVDLANQTVPQFVANPSVISVWLSTWRPINQ